MAKLARLKSTIFVASKRAWHAARPARRGRPASVVIVSGVQRSGTNMVMSALDRSWGTDVYHETDSRAFEHYSMRGLEVIERLHRNCGFPFFVIKALFEAHRIGDLKAKIPGAKAVWLFRNYDDMINSHMVNWPGGREQIEDIVQDSNSAAYRGLGMTRETLEFVRAHYGSDMNDASALALFWCYRNQLLFDQGLDDDPDTLVLRYEDLVAQPESAFRLLCAHMDLAYSSDLHALTHTGSISKRSRPDIDAAIDSHCQAMFERLDKAARKGRARHGEAIPGEES